MALITVCVITYDHKKMNFEKRTSKRFRWQFSPTLKNYGYITLHRQYGDQRLYFTERY